MASQSVTILNHGTQANRTFRIAGTLIASNWADSATIYTVPSGKRLILKGALATTSTVSGTDQVALNGAASANETALTLVLTANVIVKALGTAFIATGFLEDDV